MMARGLPGGFATVTVYKDEPTQDEIGMAVAIPRRRIDRRRHSSWTVPCGHVEALARVAALEGTVLRAPEDVARRSRGGTGRC